MFKIRRIAMSAAVLAAPIAGSIAMAVPAHAGEYVCYGTETVVHNQNPFTGTTDVNGIVVTGVSNSQTGCPDQSVGV